MENIFHIFREAIRDFYKNCFPFWWSLLAATVRFKASNLLINLLSSGILPKRDGLALNLLRYLSVAVSLFLDQPPYPAWTKPSRLETRG
jgi:hypothetical protein